MLSELVRLSEDLLMFIRPFLLISAFLVCFLLINHTIVFFFDEFLLLPMRWHASTSELETLT